MVKKRKIDEEVLEEAVQTDSVQKKGLKSKKRKSQEAVESVAEESPAAAAVNGDADHAERLRRALQRDIQQLVLRCFP